MSLSVAAEIIQDAKQQAHDKIMDLSIALIESQLGTDGDAFGDSPIDRGQRIARFEDMARRGVLDALQAISPKWAQRFVVQYQQDIRESPLAAPQGAMNG